MDDRLERIEKQLASLNEKFETLIRLEMKHESLTSRVDVHNERIAGHSARIGDLERTSQDVSKTVGAYARFLWASSMAVVVAALYYISENI